MGWTPRTRGALTAITAVTLTAALGALALAAAGNDSDPDPAFGEAGVGFIVDAGSIARGGVAAAPVDGYQSADGKLTFVTTYPRGDSRQTDPDGTGLGGLLRYTPSGQPDAVMNAGGSAGVSDDIPFGDECCIVGPTLAVAPAPDGGATVVTAIRVTRDDRHARPHPADTLQGRRNARRQLRRGRHA